MIAEKPTEAVRDSTTVSAGCELGGGVREADASLIENLVDSMYSIRSPRICAMSPVLGGLLRTHGLRYWE
ncbi:MAG: hypothetical protein KatS3mg012_0981 [Gaiellaceae bacterium]|nr:MAG: hypothetical protein KatS3mg012_0981 [Gaiellaceae bacterium]